MPAKHPKPTRHKTHDSLAGNMARMRSPAPNPNIRSVIAAFAITVSIAGVVVFLAVSHNAALPASPSDPRGVTPPVPPSLSHNAALPAPPAVPHDAALSATPTVAPATGWKRNRQGTWTTLGEQTYIESPHGVDSKSFMFCGGGQSFAVVYDGIDASDTHAGSGTERVTPVSLLVKSGSKQSRSFDFVRIGSRHPLRGRFDPVDTASLSDYLRGSASFQIEYPLSTGWVVHTYNHVGIDETTC